MTNAPLHASDSPSQPPQEVPTEPPPMQEPPVREIPNDQPIREIPLDAPPAGPTQPTRVG